MSKGDTDEDGFTLVRYNHPRHYSPYKYIQKYHNQSNSPRYIQVDKIIDCIENFRREIQNSLFYENLIEILQSNKPFDNIVCYGIGIVSESTISQYQYALLLLLWQQYCAGSQCLIYDPVLTTVDCEILDYYKMQIIVENEEGKRRVASKTLFFMPHCGKEMYNNLLWTNWGSALNKITLFGNSFQSYYHKLPSRQLKSEAEYIFKIKEFTNELKLSKFHHDDIFNDVSLHYFDTELVQKPEQFWKNCVEPVYSNNTEMILKS